MQRNREISYILCIPWIYLDCDHPIMDAVCPGFQFTSIVVVLFLYQYLIDFDAYIFFHYILLLSNTIWL